MQGFRSESLQHSGILTAQATQPIVSTPPKKPNNRKASGMKAPPRTVERAFELFCELGAKWTLISQQLEAEGHHPYGRDTIRIWSKEGDWLTRAIQPTPTEPQPTEGQLSLLPSPEPKAKTQPKAAHRRPTKQQASKIAREATANANQVVRLDPRRDRATILEDCREIRVNLREAIRQLAADRDYRPIGSVATAFERIARFETEINPESAYEWAKFAVEQGWDLQQIAEDIVRERGLG